MRVAAQVDVCGGNPLIRLTHSFLPLLSSKTLILVNSFTSGSVKSLALLQNIRRMFAIDA